VRFEEALAELEGRKESRMVPDLARILQLATLLDDPQLSYPTIHVTGTNGKTTTARAVTALACAHGITAGLPAPRGGDRAALRLWHRHDPRGVRRRV
jgi:folylpolyglutamate synthase/dihydropteroate synthase